MSDHGALVKLLIAKGIFTEDEYFNVLIEMMQQEVDSYQKRLSRLYGANITLA